MRYTPLPTSSPAAHENDAPTPGDGTEACGLGELIRAEARRLGFDAVGFAPVMPSEHGEFYRRWLAAGHHGDMAYLERQDAVARRLDSASGWPQIRSAVMVALNYYTDEPGDVGAAATSSTEDVGADAASDAARGIIARYARGRDYHRVIRSKLLALLRVVEAELGRELPLARAYVDTGPLLERELARRAGLGWFGRSTMLIHPRRGSYFFIGALLLDVELPYDTPFADDHCGTCNACVDACPTGALLGRDESGAPVIDARRCISYLTIENRGPIPRELRPLIGNRIFGCDICQEVCPWNGPKFVQITTVADFNGRDRDRERLRKRERAGTGGELPGTALPSLIAFMRMTYEEWDEWTRGSAMRRAGYAGLKRNVAVALGNWDSDDAVPVLVEALSDPEPLVRGHSAWALGEISSTPAAALEERLAVEEDSWVREELELALALPSST